MHHYLFSPGEIRTRRDRVVTWYNYDEVQHQIVIDGTGFQSTLLETGGSYAVVFNQEGEFTYHCSVHPTMRGRVVVER